MKLYLYSDFITAAWAKDPQHWRKITGNAEGVRPVRCAHCAFPLPKGYHEPNGTLANDAIERIPTMRDLVNSL